MIHQDGILRLLQMMMHHLWWWYYYWRSEKEVPRRDRWDKVVEIIQSTLTRTTLPQVFGIGILVLIPKNDQNQFRGIALLDVIYKLVSRIIHTRINDNIQYHEAVHGFRRNRGTTTAISELKLCMRVTSMNKKRIPRFTIFLDLKKAYDTLDRPRTLEIMKAYGIGPNICHIIEQTWKMDQMIPKQAGCYGTAFNTSRGVRQGDIISPTVFNIVVDAVINYCEAVYKTSHPGKELPKVIFYADDGVISGDDASLVQNMLDLYTDAFLRIGLKMNVDKTKAMMMTGPKQQNRTARPDEYKDLTSKEYLNMKIGCEKCKSMIVRRNMKKHYETKTCIFKSEKIQEEGIVITTNITDPIEENVIVDQGTTFTVFGDPIETVKEFKYLGRIVTDTDDDKATVVLNLNKAGKAWGQLYRVLAYEKNRNLRTAVSIYRSIIESVLLYGSETWVLKGTTTLHRLEIFHRRCARFLTGQFIHPQESGEWVYPHTEDVFKKAGLESIESYIEKRRVHVANYFTPESKAITEIANSLKIELNLEKVSWWKPTNPDQNPSNIR